jgi:adenylate cyclase
MNQTPSDRHPDRPPPLVEIERKFLVKNNDWVKGVDSVRRIKQGYLTNDGKKCIRVREDVKGSADRKESRYTLTTKSCEAGMTRTEVNISISGIQCSSLMKMATEGVIEKRRYLVLGPDRKLWEVDVFESGLVIAEIELNSEKDDFEKPDWLGEEVTDKKEYYNAELAK